MLLVCQTEFYKQKPSGFFMLMLRFWHTREHKLPRITALDLRPICMQLRMQNPLRSPVLLRQFFKHDCDRLWRNFCYLRHCIGQGFSQFSLLLFCFANPQAYPRKNALTKALQEHGRVIKSIDIPYYLCHEEHRRHIGIQINKGEELHRLR